MNIPRPEHPNPIFERANWQNLNGKWNFEFDFGASATQRVAELEFTKEITVPFCPESELSGINYKDFMAGVCYRKTVTVTKEQLEGRVFLNFGAADYKTFVYVNGTFAFSHRGGYVSFGGEITSLLREGENTLIVICEDDVRSRNQPCGKQSTALKSAGCHYTRTTGIWQTVWLEFTPKTHIKNVKYYPDINNYQLIIDANVCGEGTFTAKAFYEGKAVGEATAKSCGGNIKITLSLDELHLWEVGNGRLYDLELTYEEDRVHSYFGMRDLRLEGKKFLINGKSVFQRLVLDQGFYPDGIYTARDEGTLKRDIELSLEAGFNGARLHEKIFEPRFLYHCDKMGYIVWGEHANWGFDEVENLYTFADEWIEAINRDFNHPAIIGWCPFNETWNNYSISRNPEEHYDNAVRFVYDLTKQLDPTRPCIDTSGGDHIKTDIFDTHHYEQNPESLRDFLGKAERGESPSSPLTHREVYHGEPLFLSEYGGIRWDVTGESSGWGYGNAPKTEEEFIERLRGLTHAVMDRADHFGFCYTQLYDVEQEINGIYTYGREPKFDINIIKGIFSRKAAIED